MKKHLKKLTAVLMAVAMTLSLTVSAFASDTGNTVERELPTRGETQGTSKTEGPLPKDPVEVVLPVVNTPEDGRMGFFDMILDPNNLINKTDGKRYEVAGVEKTFAANQKLYFLSSKTAEGEEYGATSRPLQIINKGRKPVNVDLTLDFTYESDKFELVDSADKLARDDDGTPTADGGAENAAMYLGIIVGTAETSTPVMEPTEETKFVPLFRVDGDGDYLAASEDSIQFVFGESVTEEADKTELLTALESLILTISYADPTEEAPEDDPETTDVDESQGDPVPVPAKVSVTAGDMGDYTVVTPTNGITSENEDAVGDLAVEIQKDSTAVATITLKVAKADVKKMKPDETQTINFKRPVAGAVVHTAIDAKEDAYDYEWINPETVDDPDKYQGMTDAGYYWKQKADLTDADFPSITFKLIGDINNDPLWDNVKVGEENITFNFVWDVMQRTGYNQLVAENYGTAEPMGEGGSVTSQLPTVTVTTKGSSNTKIVLTWTKGTGTYANYVPGTTMTIKSGSTTKTMAMTNTSTATGGTLTPASSVTASTAYSNLINASATATIPFTANGQTETITVSGALRA